MNTSQAFCFLFCWVHLAEQCQSRLFSHLVVFVLRKPKRLRDTLCFVVQWNRGSLFCFCFSFRASLFSSSFLSLHPPYPSRQDPTASGPPRFLTATPPLPLLKPLVPNLPPSPPSLPLSFPLPPPALSLLLLSYKCFLQPRLSPTPPLTFLLTLHPHPHPPSRPAPDPPSPPNNAKKNKVLGEEAVYRDSRGNRSRDYNIRIKNDRSVLFFLGCLFG